MFTSRPSTMPLSMAPKIASYAIQPAAGPTPTSQAIELSQARHRLRLVSAWSGAGGIEPGNRVLELGCGQGTCTAVLAEAVGSSGHVDAVDPAPLDYGAPFTLAQAQGHLSQGPVGERIRWWRDDPVKFLENEERAKETWDVAVLAHCIWYFRSGKEVSDLFAALKGRVDRVLIAEYALHASERESVPHVLATIARSALEAHRKDSSENIQTPLSPTAVRELAEHEGWTVVGESTVMPEPELSDGRWEAGSVFSEAFLKQVEEGVEDERVRAMLRSARDSAVAAVDGIGGVAKVRTMDVWVATLVAQ